MTNQTVKFIFAFEINNLDNFNKLVKECSEFVQANEPDTLSYDWYIDKDQKNGKLYEVYASAGAFEQHVKGKVFTEIVPKYRDAMTWSHIDALGDVPDIFYAMTKNLSATHWTAL